jgi:hypothetical protein
MSHLSVMMIQYNSIQFNLILIYLSASSQHNGQLQN